MSQRKAASPAGCIAQGLLFSGVLAAGAVWASACTQIDAFKKIADYKRQYQQYKDQAEQLLNLANTDVLDQFKDLMGSEMDKRLGQIKREGEVFFDTAYSPGELTGSGTIKSGAAIRTLGGGFGQPASVGGGGAGLGGGALKHCWKSQYIATPAQSACGQGEEAQLAGMSIKPGTDGEVIQPNSEMEAEITRAILDNDAPMLDVMRSDLAWLRDNPEVWQPMRVSDEAESLSLEKVGRITKDQMRLGAILAARGLPMVDYDIRSFDAAEAHTLAATERAQLNAQATASISYIASAFGGYTTTMASIVPMKAALRDIEAGDIEGANSGDRKAMMQQFSKMASKVDVLGTESRQRHEQLMGVWLAGKARDQYGNTLDMPH